MSTTTTTLAELPSLKGSVLGTSEWFEITQDDVDAFSVLTRDWDYMHNDPQWAADKGPWGATIAHGFFLLSLLAHFHGQAGFPTLASDDEYVINYGLDRVRFIEPVRIGDRIRVRMRATLRRSSSRSGRTHTACCR